MLHTIIIYSENTPGVLYRIADLFLRRRINIESLTVSEMEGRGMSRFTISVKGEKALIEKIGKQIYRIIEVTKVVEAQEHEVVAREIALFDVSTNTQEKKRGVKDVCALTSTKIVSFSRNNVILEKSGTEKEINNLKSLLTPFGVREFVRSGRIALLETKS